MYSLIGRLGMQKHEVVLSMMELKAKLSDVWKIEMDKFRIIPMAKGYFFLDLKIMEAQSTVMSMGTVNVKTDIFRISQWVRDFNPLTHK